VSGVRRPGVVTARTPSDATAALRLFGRTSREGPESRLTVMRKDSR
jgi:hypothetical protein